MNASAFYIYIFSIQGAWEIGICESVSNKKKLAMHTKGQLNIALSTMRRATTPTVYTKLWVMFSTVGWLAELIQTM